jgi:hypothetical protein
MRNSDQWPPGIETLFTKDELESLSGTVVARHMSRFAKWKLAQLERHDIETGDYPSEKRLANRRRWVIETALILALKRSLRHFGNPW